jgi:hypothetical protein
MLAVPGVLGPKQTPQLDHVLLPVARCGLTPLSQEPSLATRSRCTQPQLPVTLHSPHSYDYLYACARFPQLSDNMTASRGSLATLDTRSHVHHHCTHIFVAINIHDPLYNFLQFQLRIKYFSPCRFSTMTAYTDSHDGTKFLFAALCSCLPLYHWFNKDPKLSKSVSQSSSREQLYTHEGYREEREMDTLTPDGRAT